MSQKESGVQVFAAIVVRFLGAAIMTVGIVAAVLVIREAWYLYEEPERIERFAAAIESGSNLDRLVADVAGSAAGGDAAAAGGDELRLTYFVAWFLAALLLLIIGMLAMSAITAGGRVALYDHFAVKRFARELARETRRQG